MLHSASVTHAQLRNPLHSMYGALAQLASGALDAATTELELATLARGIDVMIAISSDMLDVEALRLGRLRIAAAPTDVRKVLAGCKATARKTLASLHVAPDVPARISVDGLRLRQVCQHADGYTCLCMPA
jgi:signal transduction histidine kinase